MYIYCYVCVMKRFVFLLVLFYIKDNKFLFRRRLNFSYLLFVIPVWRRSLFYFWFPYFLITHNDLKLDVEIPNSFGSAFKEWYFSLSLFWCILFSWYFFLNCTPIMSTTCSFSPFFLFLFWCLMCVTNLTA